MNIYTPYTHTYISTVEARLVGVGSVVFFNRSRVYLTRCQGMHGKGTPFSLTQVAVITALVTATAPACAVLILFLQDGCSYRLLVQLTPTCTHAGPA